MLYSMARRYDEFPGAIEPRTPDRACAARMKGWYKHGVCRRDLWRDLGMPPPAETPEADWWLDAARRPLGAYYRVDTRSVTDMHVALHEVGILYASAVCHSGWLKGNRTREAARRLWIDPTRRDPGGRRRARVRDRRLHAHGFIIQNSWGLGWGSRGLAHPDLRRLDRQRDGLLGRAARRRDDAARGDRDVADPAHGAWQRSTLAASQVLRNREISPFVVDMENNGAAFEQRRPSAPARRRARRSSTSSSPRRARSGGSRRTSRSTSAIYAHGGLTGEDDGGARPRRSGFPRCTRTRIFPIFLMWETDLWSTLMNRFADRSRGIAQRPTGGPASIELQAVLEPRARAPARAGRHRASGAR